MQKSRFFLGAHPLRVVLETLSIGIVALAILIVLCMQPLGFNGRPLPVSLVQAGFTFVAGPLCMFWLATRLRRLSLRRRLRYPFLLLLAAALSLILNYIAQLGSVYLLRDISAWRVGYNGILWAVASMLFDSIVFILCRFGVRMWLFWDRLRRTQLVWSLAHALVVLLALGAGVLVLLVDGLIFYRSPVFYVVPMTMVLVVVSLCVLIALVPPFALFSYVAMRGTVQRVKTLAAATSALRAGNYQVRVPVVGEDEVAQLQSDFNAMATELQHTLRELHEQRDNVAKLLDERRELIANVSHELRTPVATVRGYLETTLMHWDGVSLPHLHRDLRVMEDETVRLQGLVEDLFTLSRAEVGKLEMHYVPTDVGELVRRVVAASVPLAWRSSKIEIVAELPEYLPPVLVDVRRLGQILHNLLHNGVRHTPPGGIVAVMVTTDGATVTLQVRDTGEGIAAEDVPYIWKRFYQSKRAHMGGGTGLGLALVKEWTEMMNGTVAVESVLGEGSCFTVCLPAIKFPVLTPLPAYSQLSLHPNQG